MAKPIQVEFQHHWHQIHYYLEINDYLDDIGSFGNTVHPITLVMLAESISKSTTWLLCFSRWHVEKWPIMTYPKEKKNIWEVLSFASLRLQAVGIWTTWTGQTSSQQDPGSSSRVGYPFFFYAPGLSSGNVNVGSPNAILRKQPFSKGGICWLPGRYFWIRLPNSSGVLLGIAA